MFKKRTDSGLVVKQEESSEKSKLLEGSTHGYL